MRILIAEDDFTSRIMLTALLKKWGFDPVITEDGKEAWDAMQQPDAPKLVILDWNMPAPDGIEICRRIRQIQISEPPYIIILTAKGEKSDIVTGLRAGANDYVAKPYDNEELLARLEVGRRMVELQSTLADRMRDLQAALENIKTLKGIVPICASCKKIRDDKGYWNQLESYIHSHTDAEFSHGICPDCMKKLYPDMFEDV